MRNLIIAVLLLVSFGASAQRVTTDSIQLASISGSDTTLFWKARDVTGLSIMFDFTNFNADDATLDLGHSNDNLGFCTFDDSRLPLTLNTTTYAKAVNGVTKSRYMLTTPNFTGYYLAIKISKVSATTGTLIWKIER